ncbi:MAG: wax ester/triacylglycerol synthase family O-acyltransferase [Micrococcales bacterium]|nr:wax ester/triacylglycerol synthase family O-acyltransferase [Micrococcales bacterium]
MKQLTGVDVTFLNMETSRSTGHVASISVLDPAELEGDFDLAHLTELFLDRLPRIPVFRRRLREVPLGLDHPYWVDDVDFDLEYHLREIALPSPGTMDQLLEQVARLHSRPLDIRRPLWETYLISGLEGGRVALYTKTHHAVLDGVGGVDLLTTLIDLNPDLPSGAPASFEPLPEPGALSMVARGLGGLVRRPLDAARIMTGMAKWAPDIASRVTPYMGALARSPKDLDGGVITSSAIGRAPDTPFNGQISPHRRIGLATVSLAEVREIKSTFGTSVNDVVLAVSAGALRRWLADNGGIPTTPLITMIPVSVRDESGKNAMGNAVTAMFTPLPTTVEDPVKRLVSCNAITQEAKQRNAAMPVGLLEDISHFTPPLLLSRATRVVYETGLFHRMKTLNLVISNVPGPNVQAYIGGAKLESIHPLSILIDGQGLNITVQGYRGALHFGLMADRDSVPDVDALARYVEEELAVLLAASRGEQGRRPALAEAPTPARKRPSRKAVAEKAAATKASATTTPAAKKAATTPAAPRKTAAKKAAAKKSVAKKAATTKAVSKKSATKKAATPKATPRKRQI